jgi:hypothetical protein
MNTDRSKTALLALTLACALTAAAAARPARPPAAECEGDACATVTLAFDEARQQYRVQNTSADRWAKVSAANLAAAVTLCLAPGGDEYLPLKSVVAPYRAAYAEARCGAPAGVG